MRFVQPLSAALAILLFTASAAFAADGEAISPFVYEFMGNVNRFDCRIQEGQAKVGPLLVAAPEFPSARDLPGLAYVRPHDITLRAPDEPGLPAVIRHVFTAGPGIRVELQRRDTKTSIEANLTHDASRLLLLTPGTEVSLTFSGARVFAAG